MMAATKNSENPHFGATFADLAACWDAIRSPFSKHGLSVMQLPTTNGAQVTVTTLLAHSSGEWVRSSLTLLAQSANPQPVGACITYGRRFGLSAVCGISQEDDDGETAEGRGGRDHDKKPAPAPSQPKKVDSETLKRSLGERMAGCKSMAEFDAKIRSDIPENLKKEMAATYHMMVERLAAEGDRDAEHAVAMRQAKGKEAA
jgi:hypothetical protein